MPEELEYRMYGLVPYNISPIQQAIQFGHAVVEYMLDYPPQVYPETALWAEKYKTFIILNGGTTNSSSTTPDEDVADYPEYKGTLNNYEMELDKHRIKYATFHEPDLNDALTAVVFLVDERVFNKKKYPDFDDYMAEQVKDSMMKALLESNQIYDDWVKLIGGEKNIWLRNFLSQFKLA